MVAEDHIKGALRKVHAAAQRPGNRAHPQGAVATGRGLGHVDVAVRYGRVRRGLRWSPANIRGLTNTMPLQVEILYNEYNFVAACARAGRMTCS
jgi:hypothetical protein